MLGPLVGTRPGKVYTGPGAQKEKLRSARTRVPPRAREHAAVRRVRAASAFSFLNGASLPEDLADTAAALDLPAMALIDTNGLSGAPRFWKAAKQAGIKALVGAEVVLERGPKSTQEIFFEREEGSGAARRRGQRARCARRGIFFEG